MLVRRGRSAAAFTQYKHSLGKALLLALELLVAADVVQTVILEFTLENVAALGVLVLVRTFLSWSLVVEIEGRWPWQPAWRGRRLRQSEVLLHVPTVTAIVTAAAHVAGDSGRDENWHATTGSAQILSVSSASSA